MRALARDARRAARDLAWALGRAHPRRGGVEVRRRVRRVGRRPLHVRAGARGVGGSGAGPGPAGDSRHRHVARRRAGTRRVAQGDHPAAPEQPARHRRARLPRSARSGAGVPERARLQGSGPRPPHVVQRCLPLRVAIAHGHREPLEMVGSTAGAAGMTRRALTALLVLVAVSLGAAAVRQEDRITVRVDAASNRGPMAPFWAFFGYDEPNYTYTRDGAALLTELAELSPVPVFVRT